MQWMPLNLTARHDQQTGDLKREKHKFQVERLSEKRGGGGTPKLSLYDASQDRTLGNGWRPRESKTYGSTSRCSIKL